MYLYILMWISVQCSSIIYITDRNGLAASACAGFYDYYSYNLPSSIFYLLYLINKYLDGHVSVFCAPNFSFSCSYDSRYCRICFPQYHRLIEYVFLPWLLHPRVYMETISSLYYSCSMYCPQIHIHVSLSSGPTRTLILFEVMVESGNKG